MLMFVLVVTWQVLGQPPSTKQTAFPTSALCEQARKQVYAERGTMPADAGRSVRDAEHRAVRVSAVCEGVVG